MGILWFVYVGNTSNLRQHLRAKHVTEYAVVAQHLKDQQDKQVPAKKQCSGDNNKEQKSTTQSKLPTQPPPKWGPDNPKQQLITEKITAMICRDMQPFSIVEDLGFRDVLKAAEPRYLMPSRKTFSTELIPQLFSKTVDVVKSDVHTAVSLAITTDGWTSKANNSYISYTAHFLNEQFEPRNYCLNIENVDDSHTAQNLANSLSQSILAWTTDCLFVCLGFYGTSAQ
jgi:hypothetical protein